MAERAAGKAVDINPGAPMPKVWITLLLLIAATATYAVARIHADSVVDVMAALAFLAERPSLAIMAEVLIMLAAVIAVASWDFLKLRAKPKSQAPLRGDEDAARAKGRG